MTRPRTGSVIAWLPMALAALSHAEGVRVGGGRVALGGKAVAVLEGSFRVSEPVEVKLFSK
ncbi:MAG: hypothetical protein HY303_06690 [Candidatus Wallbacteria bacterium]|nr:hypothetical protein [Candidatus Wallbacteria bacterium]